MKKRAGDPDADEKLAVEFLEGRRRLVSKAGRVRLEFLTGDEEQKAREALARLIWRLFDDPCAIPKWAVLLTLAIRPCEPTKRWFVFKRKRGGLYDPETHYQVGAHVLRLTKKGANTKAAVTDAMKTFGLSERAVFKAFEWLRKELRKDLGPEICREHGLDE